VQLRVVEPSAEDLTQFLKLERVGDFWRNKAGRVLLVTALSNLGSMLGAWVAAGAYAGWITL
jgi:pheromone shutdown protein TraB